MIIITHYDDMRETVQLVAVKMMFANETRAQYRARLLPLAQDHSAKCVDFPESMIWGRWIEEGIAYDESQDDLYQIMRLPLAMTIPRAHPEMDCLRIISEEQAVERIERRRVEYAARLKQVRLMEEAGIPRTRGRRSDRSEGSDDGR